MRNIVVKSVLFALMFCFTLLSYGKENPGAVFAKPKKSKSFNVVAFYSGNWDVAHISYVHEANKWFAEMAEKHHFTYDSTKNWNNMNEEFLSKYEVVMFLDGAPQTESQREAFEKYMKNDNPFSFWPDWSHF